MQLEAQYSALPWGRGINKEEGLLSVVTYCMLISHVNAHMHAHDLPIPQVAPCHLVQLHHIG